MTDTSGNDGNSTQNHEYNVPSEGATDWHVDLNENFAKIDSDIEIRDTEENKGNYTPEQGAKYEATDSGAVYHGNGDSWVLVDRRVKSISTRDVSSKPVHLITYSSSGYHKKGYDDVIAAVNDKPKQGVVSIRGNVTIDEPIAPEGTYFGLFGHGGGNRQDPRGVSSITASSRFTGDWLIDLSGIGSKWGFISDLNLFCGGNNINGIRTGQSDNGSISDISLYEPAGIGIKVESGAFDTVIERVLLDGNGVMETGIHMTGGNEPKVYASLIREYSTRGIFIDDIGHVGPRIRDTSLRGGGGDFGIQINNSGSTNNINIIGCQFENHGESAIVYSPYTNGGSMASFWIAGCHFNGNNSLAVRTDNKVGRFVIGPSNQFLSDVILNGSGYSIDGSAIIFNDYKGNNTLVNDRNKSLTVLEPSLGGFVFGDSDTISYGESSNLVSLGSNGIDQIRHTATTRLGTSITNLGKITVINKSDNEIGEFHLLGDGVELIADPTGSFSTNPGNGGTTNIYYSGSQYELENRTGKTMSYLVKSTHID